MFTGSTFRVISRAILAWLISLLLLVPVAVVHVIKRVLIRILVIALAAATFILTLSDLTNARTSEVFVAGAT